jgi:hypothetical protein
VLFLLIIIRLKEGKTSEGKDGEPTSYTHPEHPKVNFSILPNMDTQTYDAFQRYLESVDTKFDVFLIFTADYFTKKHVTIAKEIFLYQKPLFFVRTKFGDHDQCDRYEEAMPREIRASLDENSEEFNSREYEIHPISNLQPHKFGFCNLMKAIAGSLPPPRDMSFSKIPKVEEFIALKEFYDSLNGTNNSLWNAFIW